MFLSESLVHTYSIELHASCMYINVLQHVYRPTQGINYSVLHRHMIILGGRGEQTDMQILCKYVQIYANMYGFCVCSEGTMKYFMGQNSEATNFINF